MIKQNRDSPFSRNFFYCISSQQFKNTSAIKSPVFNLIYFDQSPAFVTFRWYHYIMRKLDFLSAISNFSSRSVFSDSDSSYLYSSNHDRIGAKVNSLGCCCEEIFSRPLSRIYLWWEMLGPVSHKHWHKLQTPNRTSNPWRHNGHLKIKTVPFIIDLQIVLKSEKRIILKMGWASLRPDLTIW